MSAVRRFWRHLVDGFRLSRYAFIEVEFPPHSSPMGDTTDTVPLAFRVTTPVEQMRVGQLLTSYRAAAGWLFKSYFGEAHYDALVARHAVLSAEIERRLRLLATLTP